MVLDLIVTKTDDGYTAETPSISGCETWAPAEDEAIEKIKELVAYYMNLEKTAKIKVDKARRLEEKTVYKIVFNKD